MVISERNLGPQPIEQIMAELKLKPHDIVAASTEQLTHKTIARACKGRRLNPTVKTRVTKALNSASGKNFSVHDLFNY